MRSNRRRSSYESRDRNPKKELSIISLILFLDILALFSIWMGTNSSLPLKTDGQIKEIKTRRVGVPTPDRQEYVTTIETEDHKKLIYFSSDKPKVELGQKVKVVYHNQYFFSHLDSTIVDKID